MGAPIFSCIYYNVREVFYMKKFFEVVLDITCITMASVFTIIGCCLLYGIFMYALERIISFF